VPVDPQAVRRLVHVCADAATGRAVALAAQRHGLSCARFDDAFAAAVELLARPEQEAILLVALDGLSRPEMPLLAWAAGRWPRMTIWAHGSPERLNGHLANARVKMIRIEQIGELLDGLDAGEPSSALAGGVGGGKAEQTNAESFHPLTQAVPLYEEGEQVQGGREPSNAAAESPPAKQPAMNDAIMSGLIHNEQVDARLHEAAPTGQAASPSAGLAASEPAPEAPPALKLHPPQVDLGPTLTTEELAVLLGPEESGDN
jgi:hypothetical protein